MRKAKILAAVAFATLLDSTPGSSWSLAAVNHDSRPCLPGPAISLLSSTGTFQIALISSNGCERR
jgi:hypothetical protein